MKSIHTMQADTPDKGKLKIQINSEITSFPIADASISISYTGVPEQTLALFGIHALRHRSWF